MNTKCTENSLIIALEGRIDTTNASQVESEISAVISENPNLTPVFDADSLAYISSAGLRVLMKFCKSTGKKLSVTNVSKEIFEIFDTTGFTNILDVQKKLREISVEGCELLGQGGNGSVYRLDDDKIVKVYKPYMTREVIDREREFARNAFMNGVPSVIAYDLVRCGDSFGVVFEMIKSKTLGATIKDNPDKLEEYVDKYVALAKQLHSVHAAPGTFSNLKTVLHERVPLLAQWCSKEELSLLDSLIDCIPDCDTLIHNDLHPGNIMIQDGELLLIDMPEVTTGPALYDLAGIYRDMILATQGNSSSEIERSIGLPKDVIFKIGNMFFQKYTGITDKADLEKYYQQLGLICAFNVTLVVATGAEKAIQLAPILMDKMLRGVVIPNEQALRHILSSAK
jgi:uncharacterized protein (TIGR02172 family)